MTRENAVKGLREVADWHYGKYEQTHEEDYLNDGDFLTAVANLLKALEPRLMTASDFEDNPDVDGSGFLPCWVECNGIEVAKAISLGVIQEGETLDGWTEVSMAELIPTDPSYNKNVRHWTARPSEEQRSATPW